MNYFQSDIKTVIDDLQTSSTEGLTDKECAERLTKGGGNEIHKTRTRNAFKILIEQFKNLLVILLVVAAFLSLWLGSYRDAIVLFIIVVVNSLIGFYQDWKSENILASITKLIVEKCIVIRSGIRKEIPANLLVKGDLVSLSEGDGVPADMRLIKTTSLMINEFILTGESLSREKNEEAIINKEVGISERDNCTFMGTTVAKGEAIGLVYATGMETELGKIAMKSSEIVQDISPLQKEINTLAFKITIATIILSAALFGFRILVHDTMTQALVFAIGIAAAMVPEGLPAQISISLSLGVQRLAKRNAIVKKLSSVEALGAATVIASDKTGTITKNEMSITFCRFGECNYKITGTGFEPKGEILDLNSNPVRKQNLGDKKIDFISGYLASTSKINPPDEFHKTWYPIGDPTECAFATLALKAGYNLEVLDQEYKRIQLFPFDSERKRISIIREHKGRHISFVKGSIESLLEISSSIDDNGNIKNLDAEHKNNLLSLARVNAANGLRIIALAYKDFKSVQSTYTSAEAESDLVFTGFACMMDPPHEGVKEAINAAFNAKIRVLMITGDNEITAAAIAEQIGLKNADGSIPRIINEKQLKTFQDKELKEILNDRSLIFSRVSPEEKLRIVTLLKDRKDVVAVTGDGVNDTLSLKRADIGVAMGLKGSKIAQEAATMVLLDDNFSTIVYAIKEGRTIYKNIQKNVVATLATNIAELTCVIFGFIAVFFHLPIVILAIHILLIDLIGEMLPLLALSFDSGERKLMLEYPRTQGQMVNKNILISVVLTGFIRGTIAIWAFFQVYHLNGGNPVQHEIAVTATFVTIILTQFINIFSIRTTGSIFCKYSLSNPYLFGGILLSALIMSAVIYVPFLNLFLHTGPLSINEWIYPLIGTVFYLGLSEIMKFIKKKQFKNVSENVYV